MLSVTSRRSRRAFWLLSGGTQSCPSNAALISASEPVNSTLRRSQTPSIDGVRFTMRSLRFAMSQVYRSRPKRIWPVDFKRHHCRE